MTERILVTNSGDNTASVIDPSTNTVVTGTGYPITTGSNPQGVAVTPDVTKAIVANSGSGSSAVTVIDFTASPPSTTSVTVGSQPYGVAITPDGKTAYVTNNQTGTATVSVIDLTQSPPAVSTVNLATGDVPYGVAVSPDGSKSVCCL